jgi:hypothetical protein
MTKRPHSTQRTKQKRLAIAPVAAVASARLVRGTIRLRIDLDPESGMHFADQLVHAAIGRKAKRS